MNTYKIMRPGPYGLAVDTYEADRMAYEAGALLLLKKIEDHGDILSPHDIGFDVVVACPSGTYVKGWRADTPVLDVDDIRELEPVDIEDFGPEEMTEMHDEEEDDGFGLSLEEDD